MRLIDGLTLNMSSVFNEGFKELVQLNFSIQLNVGFGDFYFNQQQFEGKNVSYSGIGYMSNSQKIPTKFKKSKKDKYSDSTQLNI